MLVINELFGLQPCLLVIFLPVYEFLTKYLHWLCSNHFLFTLNNYTLSTTSCVLGSSSYALRSLSLTVGWSHFNEPHLFSPCLPLHLSSLYASGPSPSPSPALSLSLSISPQFPTSVFSFVSCSQEVKEWRGEKNDLSERSIIWLPDSQQGRREATLLIPGNTKST